MHLKTIQTLLAYTVVCVLAFDDLPYVNGDASKEMVEQGRIQYQLIREKSNLPRYGSCWKSAVEHINDGCRLLSEDTQSEIALHLTNCFLEMSGHPTYNCELNIKPNLRAICINSMSDRAFNVYTEFYTHTQSICWFLRGQIWHETIAENTFKVGKQLEVTASNQENLLLAQKESLEIQEKMLNHGRFLEKVLEELSMTTTAHQDILKLTAQSVINLQSWIVGEVSWIESMIFYGLAMFFIFIFTSTQRTISSRLPLLFLLFANFCTERTICSLVVMFYENNHADASEVYNKILIYIWYSRYGLAILSLVLLLYRAYYYRELDIENNELLRNIKLQNNNILDVLIHMKKNNNNMPDKLDVLNENGQKFLNYKLNNLSNGYRKVEHYEEKTSCNNNSFSTSTRSPVFNNVNINEDINHNGSVHSTLSPKPKNLLTELQNLRYNLRSRQGTPDSHKLD